jgi:hypothetical protein
LWIIFNFWYFKVRNKILYLGTEEDILLGKIFHTCVLIGRIERYKIKIARPRAQLLLLINLTVLINTTIVPVGTSCLLRNHKSVLSTVKN